MRYTPHDMRPFLVGPDARRVVTLVAAARLAKARTLVGHDTGETARSGQLIHSNAGGIQKDRVVVTISFGGHGVAQQFGNRRTPATRFLTRALEG